jgi:hypothetical protein
MLLSSVPLPLLVELPPLLPELPPLLLLAWREAMRRRAQTYDQTSATCVSAYSVFFMSWLSRLCISVNIQIDSGCRPI